MPCILKERTKNSPGIITLTTPEVLMGTVFRTRALQKYMETRTHEGHWLFGVHVQGDCSSMKDWPLRPWQSFIMWPNVHEHWLAKVPQNLLLNMNCINFMPSIPPRPIGVERNVDICVISRASIGKNIYETLLILRGLMDKRPTLTATIVVPDNRTLADGNRTYFKNIIDRRFFELPLTLFSARELRQISFISSSNDSFGRFPISNGVMTDLLGRSKFMLLPSHSEGTPRVIAEALMTETPCILSRNLRSGILADLDDNNTVYIEDDITQAVITIDSALTNYSRYHVDLEKYKRLYGEDGNIPQLQKRLTKLVIESGHPVQGRWFLQDLHLRLACHGQRQNHQFLYRPQLFFDWMTKVDLVNGEDAHLFDAYDEDALFGNRQIDDAEPNHRIWMRLARQTTPRVLVNLAKRLRDRYKG